MVFNLFEAEDSLLESPLESESDELADDSLSAGKCFSDVPPPSPTELQQSEFLESSANFENF